jgi:cytochrome c peroxidase
LRNVAQRAPYMHTGQFSTLREVLRFYREQAENLEIGHQGLTDKELRQLEAFLGTLSGPLNSL